jgi:lipoprotein-anchoring transpeptidase ErfK/SrfK
MQATLEPASEANFNARDKKLLANAPYAKASIPMAYQRAIVQYHRKEAPGSIVVDTDARYLYYVLPDSRAVRYGVTVGEDALSFYGIAKVGRKEEWPTWTPTADIKRRLGDVPNFVEGGAHNPLGARGIYLFQGSKDTLFRIHGTNQPEYIGQAISSGCIRLTNEDVIDLYNRVRMGAIVVVLAPRKGDSPVSPPRMAAANGPHDQN